MTLQAGRIYGGVGRLGAARQGGATPWWLSGGIAAANCVAAYQPKGAADYATSKVNLANPGTYDAADGTAYPTWAAATGWKGNGSTQYLETNIVVAATWSVIIRYSDAITNDGCLIGCLNLSPVTRYNITPISGTNVAYGYGDNNLRAPQLATGVLAIAGNKAYRNGTQDGADLIAFSGAIADSLHIFHRKNSPGNYINAYIQAVAIYNTTLTAPQVAAISTAMAAL